MTPPKPPRPTPHRGIPILAMLFGLAPLSASTTPPLSFSTDPNTPGVQWIQQGQPALSSPGEGLWSVAMDWQDQWPADWHHASPTKIEHSGPWTILRGTLPTPKGNWEVSDAYRPYEEYVKCIRRFVWRGPETASRCTLSIRFITPGSGRNVVMPGILYHGNPSGAHSGRVPVYSGTPGEEALYEEHRFPMPFVSFEWASKSSWQGAALHSIPTPVPFAHLHDQWWSLGCINRGTSTELVLYSGPTASNGKRSVTKQHQSGFVTYPNAYLDVPPNGIIEKTFYLQAQAEPAEGTAFQTAAHTSLDIFQPYSLHGFPPFSEILESKYRFSQTRWRSNRTDAGFAKYPDSTRPYFVIGWCGQAAAPGYALQVLGNHLGAVDVDEQVTLSLNTISRAAFYREGFHTWYNYETKEWSHIELLSQGQGMNNLANAIRIGRTRGLPTGPWEAFLTNACNIHSKRILKPDWNPLSTSEAFFIAPLCKAHHLFDQPQYLKAAVKAAETFANRHISMQEPYWGGTLDASCEDKEGAYAALQGFLAVYEATSDPRFLAWARHALDVVLTYVCVWDMDLPAGRLRDHAFNTRGWTAVSPQNMHVDAYGVLMTPEIHRMGQLLNQPDLTRLAQVMFRSCGQLIDPYGSQGEQPQHTNYVQGGDQSDPDRFRGGYHETWTVFWITAHFLNAAAQLQEMGVPIWK